jgi:aspartyl-tRNA(Asn)/glutamyl-tRNA(Gln) amidotransferase subunit B
MNFTPVVGLEIHVELNLLKTKMFCGCPAEHFNKEPNTQTCPVCLGLPGALPVANIEGIRRTLRIGLALGSTLAKESKFDRKNYFYPDLPKGYQISQYDQPLCRGGEVMTSFGSVGLERVHLEEDTAKLQHVTLKLDEQKQLGVDQADVSFIDFNRSGVGLVEIVTKPDIHSPEQAREYGKNLVQILRFLGVSDCDMEKGSLRLEANISVQTDEEKAAGRLPPYKVEVKNLNSFRFLERSIRYEIARHSEMREKGETPKQETRGWNDAKGTTYSQRSKEEAEDYRYFPDPDIPPLVFDDSFFSEISSEIPELPAQITTRWQKEYALNSASIETLVSTPESAHVAEVLLALSKKKGLEPQKSVNAVINHKVATNILEEADALAKNEPLLQSKVEEVLTQVEVLYAVDAVDDGFIAEVVAKVVADPVNQDAVQKFKAGKTQVIGFFLGQVMRTAGKKLDGGAVTKELTRQLSA